jgi:NitT/TauT family transport system permease protein
MKIMNKRVKYKDALYPLGAVFGLIALWDACVYFLSIPTFLLPGPNMVMKAFISNSYLLYKHSLVTLYETFLGFIIAILFSVLVSVAVVWSKPIARSVMPFLVFLQTIPKITVAPLFIIWFGFGYFPKVLMSFLLAYFPIVIEMTTGLQDVQPGTLDLVKSMSANSLQIFTKIRIPNSLPYLFTGLKLGILMSLVGATVGEFMGAEAGLGYLIILTNDTLKPNLLFATLVVILLLGKAIYSFIEWAERHMISWHVVMREKEKEKVLIST